MKKYMNGLFLFTLIISINSFGMKKQNTNYYFKPINTGEIEGDYISPAFVDNNKLVLQVFVNALVGTNLKRVLVLDLQYDYKVLFDSQDYGYEKLEYCVNDQVIIQNKKIAIRFAKGKDKILCVYDIMKNKTIDFKFADCTSKLNYFFSDDTSYVIIEHGNIFSICNLEGKLICQHDVLFEKSCYKLHNGFLFVESLPVDNYQNFAHKKLKVLDVKNKCKMLFDSEKYEEGLGMYGYRMYGQRLFVEYIPCHAGRHMFTAPTKLVIADLSKGGQMIFQTNKITKYQFQEEEEKLFIEYKHFDNQDNRFKNSMTVLDLNKSAKPELLFSCLCDNFMLSKDKKYMVFDTLLKKDSKKKSKTIGNKDIKSKKKFAIYKLIASCQISGNKKGKNVKKEFLS